MVVPSVGWQVPSTLADAAGPLVEQPHQDFVHPIDIPT